FAGLFRKDKKETTELAQEKKEKGDNLKVLLTAAPKKIVERFIRIFKAADLELLSLETEAFALERSLVAGDPAPIMIIDIGAVSSDVTIIDNSIPILTRSIDVGGSAITKAVMTSLNVDLSRAEQFKRDIGFSVLGPSDLPDIIKSTLNPIINEVKYSLDIYLSQSKHNMSLEKIILTGGSAWLPELVSYLSKLLDVKVIIGDPWDKIVYPLELKPVLSELGPRFAVAVGLAMREI
ncbi:pilus assembly protein PilM, partial [Candidatus Kuenenbacteria bacterium]|nr:pilus assembly protein PilM [Candidatus Kuenenbacteria bacterium]